MRVCLFVCVRGFMFAHVDPYVYLFIPTYLSASFSIYICIYLSAYLHIYLVAYLPISAHPRAPTNTCTRPRAPTTETGSKAESATIVSASLQVRKQDTHAATQGRSRPRLRSGGPEAQASLIPEKRQGHSSFSGPGAQRQTAWRLGERSPSSKHIQPNVSRRTRH